MGRDTVTCQTMANIQDHRVSASTSALGPTETSQLVAAEFLS